MKTDAPTNPVKVIRAKCLDCCAGSSNEVKLCTAERCPLWPCRFGKNPYRKKVERSEEEIAAMRERMKAIRSASVTNQP